MLLIKDRLRRSYKAQLPPPTRSISANGNVLRTDLRSRAYISRDVKHDLLHYVMTTTNYFLFDNF